MATEAKSLNFKCFPFSPRASQGVEPSSKKVNKRKSSGRNVRIKEPFGKATGIDPNISNMKAPKLNSMAAKQNNFASFLRRFKLCNKAKELVDKKKENGELDDNNSYEMNEESHILTLKEVNLLGQSLPPIAIGNPWKLAFSTTNDGFCLQSLYRKMSLYPSDTPVLIVIQDMKDRIFGVLASDSIRPSNHFYGTSQTFLFQMSPRFQIYNWSGDNFYFIKGNTDSIIFGSGNGNFGLWLDGDLNKGRTQSCQTFNNPALVPEEDFTVQTIECWTFDRSKSSCYISPLAEDVWVSHCPDDSSLIMEKHDAKELDANSEGSRSSSLRSKAEKDIVNDYIIKLTDELRIAFHYQLGGECKPELIIGRSEILDIQDVERIADLLDEKSCHWFLGFSTLLNGDSLDMLYMKAAHGTGTTLLLIKDTQKRVFGALLSNPPGLSSHFYGTKECLVFQLRPDFHVYRWAGHDTKFMFGTEHVFRVGAMDETGNSALTLTSKLTEGKTGSCSTFASPALVPESVFQIKILECWHFEPHIEL